MGQTVTQTTRETVDLQTGEVVRTVNEEVTRWSARESDEPDYIKLYVDAWVAFRGAKGIRSDVVCAFLRHMSYADEGQLIYVNSAMKEGICNALGISMKTLNNELTKLTKVGIFKRVARGTYAVNPELVGRGSWKHVKRLRATFEVIGQNAGSVTVSIDQ